MLYTLLHDHYHHYRIKSSLPYVYSCLIIHQDSWYPTYYGSWACSCAVVISKLGKLLLDKVYTCKTRFSLPSYSPSLTHLFTFPLSPPPSLPSLPPSLPSLPPPCVLCTSAPGAEVQSLLMCLLGTYKNKMRQGRKVKRTAQVTNAQ